MNSLTFHVPHFNSALFFARVGIMWRFYKVPTFLSSHFSLYSFINYLMNQFQGGS